MNVRRLLRSVVVMVGTAALLVTAGVTPVGAAGEVIITGYGWGHGRGLSQWGALGYAVNYGWSAGQIVDHYYRGTVAGQAGDPTIGVELLGLGGRDLIATAPNLTVNGALVPGGFVLVRRNADGNFSAFSSTGCGGPWGAWNGSLASGTVVSSSAPSTDPANHVQVCEAGQVRGYRGYLQMINTGSSSAVVNGVPLEDYLRGVVPRESPAGWASQGGGRGAQALQAQAIAARSYAIAAPRSGYATTCDTTTCQVYGGEYTRPQASSSRTSLEDPRTDAAIAATAGVVRKNSAGAVSRTEFSSSSGGWTAGGVFPAVEDLGDAISGNPNRNWSVTLDPGDLGQRLGTARVTNIRVTQRNGLGAEGGRVQQVVVDTDNGSRTFTGVQFRSLAGLKSDWFSVSIGGESYAQSASFVRALYNDVLQRQPTASEVSPWAGQVAAGTDRSVVARQFTESAERMRRIVDEAYSGGLRRSPDSGGYNTWVRYLASGATLNDLNAAVYGSAESLRVLGGGDNGAWVDGMYQGLLGRSAAPAERSHWTAAAGSQGTGSVAWQISASAEARKRRLNAYYEGLLQRPVDSSGLQSWMPLMQGRGDFVVPTFIVSSSEYWMRSPQRFP